MKNDAQLFYLAEATKEFVGLIQQKFPGVSIDVTGSFKGRAENNEKGDDTVIYNGEFGSLRGGFYSASGDVVKLNLNKGDPLKNRGIAVLRAYAVANRVEEFFKGHGDKVRLNSKTIVALESYSTGPEFRSAEIHIKITDSRRI